MNNLIKVIILISLLSIVLSCDLPITEGENITETEPWGCIQYIDSTNVEWVARGEFQATFTSDSNNLIYRYQTGIFCHDSTGVTTQLSDLQSYEYRLISPNLDYVIYIDSGDIFRKDLNGSNIFNLTNTPDVVKTEPSISNDGEYVTFKSIQDSLCYISTIDITGIPIQSVLAPDVVSVAFPKFNIDSNEIYYVSNFLNSSARKLNSICLIDSIIREISPISNIDYEISGDGQNILFVQRNNSNSDTELVLYKIEDQTFKAISPEFLNFSINYNGTTIVASNSIVSVFNVDTLDKSDLGMGENPIISPDGSKVYYTKRRTLPIKK